MKNKHLIYLSLGLWHRPSGDRAQYQVNISDLKFLSFKISNADKALYKLPTQKFEKVVIAIKVLVAYEIELWLATIW